MSESVRPNWTLQDQAARWIGISTAAVDAVLATSKLFAPTIPMPWLSDVLIGSAVILAAIFFVVLFDRDTRLAVDAANRGLQQGKPFSLRWISPTDPTWGLFGVRSGNAALKVARAATLVVFIISCVLGGGGNPPIAGLLAAVSFALSTLLVIGQLKLHGPVQG